MQILTLAETSDLLRVSKRTLMRWRAEGKPPRSLVIAGRVKYLDEDVNSFIEQQYSAAMFREEAIQQGQR